MGHSSLPIWKSLGTSLASLMMTFGMGGLSWVLFTVVFSLSRETKCSFCPSGGVLYQDILPAE